MSKNLESFETLLRHIEAASHAAREKLNLRGASDEEKVETSLMYLGKELGVIQGAALILSTKEYNILCDFDSGLKLV